MLMIFEIVLIVVVMCKVADAESRSPVVWSGLTLLLCLAATAFIPLYYLAPIIGGAVAFVTMLIANALRS